MQLHLLIDLITNFANTNNQSMTDFFEDSLLRFWSSDSPQIRTSFACVSLVVMVNNLIFVW